MNNTKWNEIYQAFYYENELKADHPLIQWRTKDKESGYICSWDGTWTHFGCEPRDWDRIEYLQIRLTDDNKDLVMKSLHAIHVPGIVEDDVVTIYGYRMDVDYLQLFCDYEVRIIEEMEMGLISGIHHVSMKANSESEYNKALDFYLGVLGLKEVKRWDTGIMIDTGAGLIEIFNNADDKLEKGTIRHFAFDVSDVDACVKRVSDAGYEVFIGPKDIVIPSTPALAARIAFVYGPLGEEIEFFETKEQ